MQTIEIDEKTRTKLLKLKEKIEVLHYQMHLTVTKYLNKKKAKGDFVLSKDFKYLQQVEVKDGTEEKEEEEKES